jgi:drug/metabolite transporter (DMT)-like permease
MKGVQLVSYHMNISVWIGLLSALFAAFVWALNFIVPFVIGRYTVFDFAFIRFVAAGLICLTYLAARSGTVRALPLRDWLLALWLGILGYLGYFLALVGAAIYGGPVIAPAILGLVPIVLAIAGNLYQRTVPWRALGIPLALVALGLILIRDPAVTEDPTSARSVAKGVALALLAVALWTWFGLLNQSALARRPSMKPGIWTALIMVGAGLGMVLFAPLGYHVGLFRLPQLGFGWTVAGSLYAWSIALALTASIGGALAWTIAAQRLPVVLTAQLVIMEAVFGTILGLAVHRRWPSLAETAGMSSLFVGVVIAIRVFDRQRQTGLAAS